MVYTASLSKEQRQQRFINTIVTSNTVRRNLFCPLRSRTCFDFKYFDHPPWKGEHAVKSSADHFLPLQNKASVDVVYFLQSFSHTPSFCSVLGLIFSRSDLNDVVVVRIFEIVIVAFTVGFRVPAIVVSIFFFRQEKTIGGVLNKTRTFRINGTFRLK